MSRSHGTPGAPVVPLLLLLCVSHPGMGRNCNFSHQPFPTTDVLINPLKEHLLLDYPVSLPSNLQSDEHCLVLWQLHFISEELRRMQRVAGSELSITIHNVADQLALAELFEQCHLNSDCVEFERSNISVFLDSVDSVIQAGKSKMEMMETLDFSNCTLIQCRSGSLSTPYPGYSAQVLGTMQASKSAILQRHHWLLIPIPLLACLFSVVKFSGRVPFQPLPLQV